MSACPQGCSHPAFGSETMVKRTERVRNHPPQVIDHLGETVVLEERVVEYLSCRVCGWRIDL